MDVEMCLHRVTSRQMIKKSRSFYNMPDHSKHRKVTTRIHTNSDCFYLIFQT